MAMIDGIGAIGTVAFRRPDWRALPSGRS